MLDAGGIPGEGWLRVADTALLVFAFLAPVYLVLRLGGFGVLLGAFVHWATLILAGEILTAYGRHEGAYRMLDAIWFLFGWIWGLIYAGIISVVKSIVLPRSRPTDLPEPDAFASTPAASSSARAAIESLPPLAKPKGKGPPDDWI